MAPFIPEEVDVFTVPHSRMKGLVNEYVEKLQTTNFSNVADLTILLDSLRDTFKEFKLHEQIENTLIMKRLRSKLKQLSIRNTMVCNCHKDSHLTDMMTLVQEGFAKKTEQDRLNYSRQLKKALEEFTEDFIPHMKQEEEVFQPMLLEYFTYDELCELKQKVIESHLKKDSQHTEKGVIEAAEKDESCDSSSESEEDSCSPEELIEGGTSHIPRTGILDLPQEISTQIFSHLSPHDLAACAQVCTHWQDSVKDPVLWREIHPRRWARGEWDVKQKDLHDEEDEEEDDEDPEEDRYQIIDDDADIDESADSEGDPNQSEQSRLLHREAHILLGLVKHVLPSVGNGVKILNLANCHALTNTMLQRLLKLTPNIEYLNLSETRISDSGLKILGKNGCGANLHYLNLSGCRVSDTTMERLGNALVINDESHTEVKAACSNECLCEKMYRERQMENKSATTPATNMEALNLPPSRKQQQQPPLDEDKDVDDSESFYTDEGTEELSFCSAAEDLYHEGGGFEYDPPFSEGGQDPRSGSVHLVSTIVAHATPEAACHVNCSSHGEGEELRPIEECALLPRPLEPEHLHYSKLKPPPNDKFCVGYSPATRDKNRDEKTMYNNVINLDDDEADEFQSKILKPPRMLSFLNLSGCYQITDEGLRSLAKAGPLTNLTYLDLSGCLLLTGQGLNSLTDVCPNLDHQTFFYCDNILDGPYTATASGCQNLECARRVCCRKGE